MKASIALAAVIVGIFGQASPLDTDASVNKKGYDIQWCKKEHYRDCTRYIDLTYNICYKLDSGDNNKAESVKHSSDVDCYYYNKRNCKGDALKAKGDYDELPSDWKDQITSWYCKEDGGGENRGDRNQDRGERYD